MINTPVKLFPIAPRSSNSAGLVVAVIIGLALFTAAKKNVAAASKKAASNA